ASGVQPDQSRARRVGGLRARRQPPGWIDADDAARASRVQTQYALAGRQAASGAARGRTRTLLFEGCDPRGLSQLCTVRSQHRGRRAASLIYFDKPASQLSLPEALTLAVIPQDPSRRAGGPESKPAQDASIVDSAIDDPTGAAQLSA